jgi:crossover junction endodeoxyribonuclease RuvC
LSTAGNYPTTTICCFLLLPVQAHRQIERVGISIQQFEQMKNRVAGKRSRSAAALPPPQRTVLNSGQVILGIDPSLRGTGFGVIRNAQPHPQTLEQGTISCPATWERSRCLVKILRTIRDLIKRHKPTVCAIEGLFFAQNLQTALIMGEARGAAMAAIAGEGLEIYEIAPRKVKQAIVGYGAAQKIAVAKMVQRMLQLPELPAPDAADALALALAHAQTQNVAGLAIRKRL